MKKIVLAVFAFGTLSAYAAPGLTTYYCKHQKDPRLESRVRYDFRIVENTELASEGHDARRAVTIERLRVIGASARKINSFGGIATYDDVEYAVYAAKRHDFLFSMYLDENDPAVVVSHDSRGAEIRNKYDCSIQSR